jgi:hypothetical protein
LITIKSEAAAREKMISAPVARLHSDGASPMSVRADNPVPPAFGCGVDGDGIAAEFQDGASPRTAGAGKAVAAEPSCFRAEA